MKHTYALTNTDILEVKRQLSAQGFELANVGPIIITGRNGQDSVPAMCLRYTNGNEPIMETVCQHEGGWWLTDGVRAVERVA